MTGSSDDGRKDSSGSVVASESGFAHAGSVIDNESRKVVVHHFLKKVIYLASE